MRAYANPARMGFLLGLVLLASFLLAHRGIGASGAFAVAAGAILEQAGRVPTDAALADRIPTGVTLRNEWIVLELIALMIGGYISARVSGRLVRAGKGDTGVANTGSDSAPGGGSGSALSKGRLWRALSGGLLMGVGARIAYGCTSGLALSGGALLATGAWIFIPLAFGAAILVTLVARRGEA